MVQLQEQWLQELLPLRWEPGVFWLPCADDPTALAVGKRVERHHAACRLVLAVCTHSCLRVERQAWKLGQTAHLQAKAVAN
jgi:hypothetical protein